LPLSRTKEGWVPAPGGGRTFFSPLLGTIRIARPTPQNIGRLISRTSNSSKRTILTRRREEETENINSSVNSHDVENNLKVPKLNSIANSQDFKPAGALKGTQVELIRRFG
jgi:hypothetical protein